MILKEKTFYVAKYDGREIVLFNSEKIEVNFELREATQLEKEYWTDSMAIVDGESEENFGAVTLCDFNEWQKQKGYK